MNAVIVALASLGRWTLEALSKLGRSCRFFIQTLSAAPAAMLALPELSKQMWRIGVLTVLIIIVSGLFVGMVLGLQGYNTLVDFGAEESLGVAVATALTRELGPVLSALLFAGRAGSALTAEIGLMKATEQLAAMEMMAVDPIRRVIAPRLIAGIISLPLLAAIFTAIGIIGGNLVGVGLLGVDNGAYWSQMQANLDLVDDVLSGVVLKSVVFAILVTWVAVFEGYDAFPTSEGVSSATTRTVVTSSLGVLGLDFILTALLFD